MSDNLHMDWASQEPTQRVSILVVIPRLLKAMGHSPDSVLAPLGLPSWSDPLDDPELLRPGTGGHRHQPITAEPPR